MKFYFSIFLFIFLSVFSYAKQLDITEGNNTYIGNYSFYFEDENSTFDINRIKNFDEKRFKKLEKSVFVSFFTDSTYWFKTEVINNSNHELKRYFVVDTPWIDTINIYIYDKHNKLTKYKIGNTLPFSQRTMDINLLNQVHTFQEGKSTIFLEVKTRDPYILPVSLLSEKDFFQKLRKMEFLEISTYSIVIAILIFNFLIFIITKYRPYMYYTLYLFSYLIMSMGYDSHTFKFIFYDYPDIQSWMQSVPILFYIVFSLLFANSFLELKEKLPLVNKYLVRFLYIHCFMILLTIVLGYKYNIIYATCLTPFVSFLMLYLGIHSYKKGNNKAIFFVVATIFGSTGAFFTAGVASLLIDYNWYFFKGVDIGVVIDSILFSIALAYRYTSLNVILEKTKNEVEELNLNLEQKVKQRTEKLDQELENRTVLLKELSHRVKNNLQIISVLLSMDKEKIKDKDSKEVLQENISRIKSISILYENFLEVDNPNQIDVNTYIYKYLSSFQKSLTGIDISLSFKTKKIYLNQKDLIPIGLVINELITNSIKYGFVDTSFKKIDILFTKDDKNIYFEYFDNGVGANIEKLKKGFGYQLLSALVEFQLEGTLDCKNQDGLKYFISIPILKNED